tara:strand:+ start:364 stop:1047 length:684 start_codon:yes stop_codon:yes gene_type:complete
MLDSKVIIALDYSDEKEVWQFCERLDNNKCKLKVGKQLFTKYGPSLVEKLQSKGFKIFLDLKFHDIPTTVYKASIEAYKLGIWMLNVHALGGAEMMRAALQARDEINSESKLIGVTVLTSHSDESLSRIGIGKRDNLAKILANQVSDVGLDGVVCSPSDIESIGIREESFLFVTPGIRLSLDSDDHNNAFTPKQACSLGADYIVIGRPITESDDPMCILDKVVSSTY